MKSIIASFSAFALFSVIACGSSPSTDEASDSSEVNASPTQSDQTGQGMNDILRQQYDRYLRGDNSPAKSPGGHWRATAFFTNNHAMSPAEHGNEHFVFTHMGDGGGEADLVTRFFDGDPHAVDVGNGFESHGTFALTIKAVQGGPVSFVPVLALDETRTSPGMPINKKSTLLITSPSAAPTGPAKAGDKIVLTEVITSADGSRHDTIGIELVRDEAPTYCNGWGGPDYGDIHCAPQMVGIAIPDTQWCPSSHACVDHQCQPSCIGR